MVFGKRKQTVNFSRPPLVVTPAVTAAGILAQDNDVLDVILAVQGVDPGFDTPAFLAEAKRLYLTVREAWAAGDLTGARGIIGEQMYAKLDARLLQARRAGLLAEVPLPDEVSSSFIGATGDPVGGERIRVRFALSGQMNDIELPSKAVLRSSGRRRWVESWEFTCLHPGQDHFIPGVCYECRSALEPGQEFCAICKSSALGNVKHFKVTRIEVMA